MRAESLEVAARRLGAFNRFEERLEVALAEANGAPALDKLEEEGGAVLHHVGEDLEELASRIFVGQDL